MRRTKSLIVPLLGIWTLLCCEQFVIAQTHSLRATISKTEIDSQGHIHVFSSDGHEFVSSKKDDQVSCSSPQIAEDETTVGWLAEYPNCCTSYPIPLSLVIYRDGKVIQRIQPRDRLAIWDWKFANGGKQVAFSTGPIHGNFIPHFWLHAVSNGRLLARWDGHLNEKRPSWVSGLRE